MVLETKRLFIRPFCLEDIQPLAEISADPAVMRYIGGGAQSYEQVKNKVIIWMKNYELKHYSLQAIIEKESNQFIGFCGLIDQVIEDVPYIELGYRLAQSHWNKKIATEAALAIKDVAFNVLKLPEIISIIQPENMASIRVAEKIGMTPKKCLNFNGNNVVIYHQYYPY